MLRVRSPAAMHNERETRLIAFRLVAELGDRAVAHSRARFVELTAASDEFGAAFWRDVMTASQKLVEQKAGADKGGA